MENEACVQFSCGHTRVYDAAEQTDYARCAICGSEVVARVTAPPPRITMMGQPYVPKAATVTIFPGKETTRG